MVTVAADKSGSTTPAKPADKTKPSAKTKATKTGDQTPVIPLLLICMLAGGTAVFTLKKRKWS